MKYYKIKNFKVIILTIISIGIKCFTLIINLIVFSEIFTGYIQSGLIFIAKFLSLIASFHLLFGVNLVKRSIEQLIN